MRPRISVVIPVHNTEMYLKECLDSVLNQTMSEIQVVCIDDGSTDSSPMILSEYAKRDARITIITQEHQGPGSARNTAFPFLEGKYTHYVDSDDWVDIRYYEYSCHEAETSDAEIIVTGCHIVNEDWSVQHILPEPTVRTTWNDKAALLLNTTAAWYKIFRTDFLRANNLRFCDGIRPNNDLVHHWKAVILASKIQLLHQPLYYYRIREGSCQTTGGEGHLKVVDTIEEIRKFLVRYDFYKNCSSCLTCFKLTELFEKYEKLRPEFKTQMKERILASLRNEDWQYIYGENTISPECQEFYIQLMEK